MRCFIAAWPDAQTRERLAQLTIDLAARCASSRPMRAENLHLTLAFIGNLDDSAAARVARVCREIRVEPVAWRLDTIVHFARPRVLAAGGETVLSLASLAATTREMLDQLVINYDRKPFLPHVTLLRNVAGYDGGFTLAPAMKWEIDNIALYRSTQGAAGVNYQIVE